MDKMRFSRIAHGDLPIWNPAGVSHLQRYVSRLLLPEHSTVLDIGCGRGYLLGLILSQYKAQGIGVDTSSFAIAEAALAMPALLADGRLILAEKAFDPDEYDAASFDLVVCIGSTHAVGNYRAALRAAKRLLRPGGMLLVGEGYWRCTPSPDYLGFLKMSADEHSDHQGNQTAGIDEGFQLVSASQCSQQEWDAYEDQYARNVEAFVRANEKDPDAQAMLQRIRPWREAYLRWGRHTLGFGLYLFRAPPDR